MDALGKFLAGRGFVFNDFTISGTRLSHVLNGVFLLKFRPSEGVKTTTLP